MDTEQLIKAFPVLGERLAPLERDWYDPCECYELARLGLVHVGTNHDAPFPLPSAPMLATHKLKASALLSLGQIHRNPKRTFTYNVCPACIVAELYTIGEITYDTMVKLQTDLYATQKTFDQRETATSLDNTA